MSETLTPEQLAKIKANFNWLDREEEQGRYIRQHVPHLFAAIEAAWAERNQLREALQTALSWWTRHTRLDEDYEPVDSDEFREWERCSAILSPGLSAPEEAIP